MLVAGCRLWSGRAGASTFVGALAVETCWLSLLQGPKAHPLQVLTTVQAFPHAPAPAVKAGLCGPRPVPALDNLGLLCVTLSCAVRLRAA